MTVIQRYWQQITYSNILYFLLFLYPLFATMVRHWNSALFGLLVLLGITYFFSQRQKDNITLHKYEKIFLWLLAGNFFVFLLTSLINPPVDIREIRFDIEARFLLVIPLYYLLSRTENAFNYLGFGAIISIFIVFSYGLYYLSFINPYTYTGIYSHLYTAPVLLMCMLIGGFYLLGTRMDNRLKLVLSLLMLFAGLYTIYYARSRITYLSVFIMAIFTASIMTQKWWKLVSVVTIIMLMIVAGLNLENVRSKIKFAYTEFNEYISYNNEERISADITTSIATRIEMWRIAPLVLQDYPIFGVGNGNYNSTVQKYVDEKLLNPVVARHGHAHNVFVNVLIVKGLIGLVITCLVLFYPLFIYVKSYKYSPRTAALGILFVTVIFLVSMNAVAPFVKSNFVATYLLLSLVIFQHHMHKIRNKFHG